MKRTAAAACFIACFLFAAVKISFAQDGGSRPIKLKTLTPNLMVADVNRTVDFYRETLGFELVLSVPESGQLNWAMMRRDEAELMFQSRESLTDDVSAMRDVPIGGSLVLFIRMADLDALYDLIKDRVDIVVDVHTTFYGMKEFAIRDIDGYILIFAEEVR